jgi:IS605 OrfB family transposase
MQLVEKHIITKNHLHFNECDQLCLKTKNLYNSCLYVIKQAYLKDKTNLLYELHNLMKDTEQYKVLPAKVSSSVLLMVQKNFKSYFKASAEYYKNPDKFLGKPRLPNYKDSIKGRFVASYTNQAISKKVFKKTNKILLSKTNIEFYTRIKDFNQLDCIRIIPRIDHYVIEVIYTIPDVGKLSNNERYCSIDLGINNLATITSNIKEVNPLILNGKPLKSINQYYNKKLSKLSSILETRNNKKTSNNTNKLTNKRNNKVNNYLHNTSKYIIDHCKNNEINTLVIGKNDNWKQETNMNVKNNQNFVNIPHSRFIEMISYKCELSGINIILQEESYTSKASFLNLDPIPTYGNNNSEIQFSGYRKHRGLYKLKSQNKMINADVNGSYNILRKAIPNAFANGIEGIGVYPIVIKTIK